MTLKNMTYWTIRVVLLIALGLTAHGTKAMQQQDSADIEQLLSDVRDPQLRGAQPERVLQAISRLGEMKSVAAANDLVDLLAFERSVGSQQDDKDAITEIHVVTTSERYPATQALIEIGRPTLSAVARAIGRHPIGSLESENARYVIWMIFRENPARAVDYLRKTTVQASSGEERDRLNYALDKTEELLRKMGRR